MKTKPIPIIITLAAAFISCVISIMQKATFSVFISRLAIVVAIFLVMGTIIKLVLDYSFKTLEPPVSIDDQIVSDDDKNKLFNQVNPYITQTLYRLYDAERAKKENEIENIK